MAQAFKPEAGADASIVKVFKGVGALGTSGAVIAPPPKDDDDDDDHMKKLKHKKESKEGRDERRRAFFSSLPGAELWADDFMPEAEKELNEVGSHGDGFPVLLLRADFLYVLLPFGVSL